MRHLTFELRSAVRRLRRRPAFAALVVGIVALAIGATTAVFSLVYSIVLRPLALPEPERVVLVFEDHRGREGPEREVTGLSTFADWRERGRAFTALAGAYNAWDRRMALSLGAGAEAVLVGAVSPGYFTGVLRARPAAGRAFIPEEEIAGRDRVVLLSHGLWRRAFGGDPGALGRQVVLQGEPRTVVGILPRGFEDPLFPGTELWIPLAREPGKEDYGSYNIRVAGRLRPGVSLSQAEADLAPVMADLAARFPEDYDRVGIHVAPLHEVLVGPVRAPTLALFGAVLLVLAIAGVNVANLLIARAAEREREIAVRTALGAGRGRILEQVLTESVTLAAAGVLLGIGLGYCFLRLLVRLAPPATPRLESVALHPPVLAFAVACGLAVGLLFGALPAWRASRIRLAAALREGGRTATGQAGLRLRRGLVVGEVALSLALLVGAGLLVRTLLALGDVDPGFAVERLLAVELQLPEATYPEPEAVRARVAAIEERLRAHPEVEAAAAASVLPLTDVFTDAGFQVEGAPPPPEGRRWVQLHAVTPGLFAALGIPLRAGRDFTAADGPEREVLIVNEVFAEQLMAGQEPLGRRVRLGGAPDAPWWTVVGVAGSVRHGGLAGSPEPQVYVPYARVTSRRVQLVVRAAAGPETLVPFVRTAVRESDPDLAPLAVRTGRELLRGQLAVPRFLATLLAAFAAVAVALAAAGIYGVMAFLVARRRREIGLRMALGARPAAVLGQVMRQGGVLAGAGIAAGVLATLALSRGLGSLLFGVGPGDPWTLMAAATLLLAVALAACLAPALRAARVDPAITLREE